LRILVTGAAGMIGRKLCARLAAEGAIDGRPIEAAHLVDVVAPAPPAGARFATLCEALDVAAPTAAAKAIAARPDVVFHLAAVVSGEAESDFAKGYAVNLDATRALFEAIRLEGEHSGGAYRPRLIYASSIAVFGAPFPETIDDDFLAAPLTSYGAQKAIVELLIADYSRRGILDGVALRLPTVVVRPGPANRAVSGFFSSIIREPLSGREAILPAPEATRLWCASPRAAVGFFVHAAALDLSRLGPRRSLTMPGISTTVGEQIEALRRAGGDSAVRRIHRQSDELSIRIVSGWPGRFAARRALALGFAAESSFDEIVRVYLEDDHVAAVA
jgi:nucleoside-diphosphate-sugar epimerase